MKLLTLFSILLFASVTHATTTGRMVGPFMLISLASHTSAGTDSTPERLYQLMNRPEQPSNMGKGKALASEKRVLNFVCNDRGQGAFQCAINIHKTQFSQISSGKATFEVHGAAAKAYFDQFHSQGEIFSFKDDSSLFAIEATPEKFLIVFSSSGV